jgi:hypothetical protein
MIGLVHRSVARARKLLHHLPQARSANADLTTICFREWRAGEIERGQCGVLNRQLAQIFGHPGPLFELFRGAGQPLTKGGPWFQLRHTFRHDQPCRCIRRVSAIL